MYNIYTQNNNYNDSKPPALPVEKKPSFEKYIDPTGELPTGKFKFEMWFLKNELRLYKMVVGFLIAFNVFTWGYSLWKIGDYVIFGIEQDNILYQELATFPDYTVWHEHFAPAPLEILTAGSLPGGSKKTDVYAMIANQDEKFFVSFDYFFVNNGNPTVRRRGFLLAKQNQLVAELGLDSVVGGNIEVVLENFIWKRINTHRIASAPMWQADRINFVVSDLDISVPTGPEDLSATAVRFNLANRSAYSYREVNFYVVMTQGEAFLAILPLQVKDFLSNETRPIDLRSYIPNLYGTGVKIFPLINIYDASVYLPPSV